MCSSHAPEAGADARCQIHGTDTAASMGVCWFCEDAQRAADESGTPCLVCGAPILGNIGHDAGCMADGSQRSGIAAYMYDIARDIDAAAHPDSEWAHERRLGIR